MLVLDYLRRSRKITPEIEMKAVEYVNLGYQRLLTFEVDDPADQPRGGFDWYGKPPANVVLAAYGLIEFTDMAKVYEIDRGVIDRTRAYLYRHQAADGTWDVGQKTSWSWTGLSGKFVTTAYVCWSLAESGDKGEQTKKGLAWLKDNMDSCPNAYAKALIVNALLAYDKNDAIGEKLLKDLESQKVEKDNTCHWKSDGQTMYFAEGDAASIETTALTALALMKTAGYAETINHALAFLVKVKDARGCWGSTSGTILAMKALLGGMSGVEQKGDVTIVVDVNGTKETVKVTPDQADVMKLVDLKSATKTGRNAITIDVTGETAMMYQVVGRYYVPWDGVPEDQKPLTIDVKYDRTKLTMEDKLSATASFKYRGSTETFMIVADLGIPPGFTVDTSGFEKMVEEKKLDRFSTTGRQITLYFGKIAPGSEWSLAYDLYPKYPIKAKTPKAEAWMYYTPDVRGESEPVEIEVTK